MEKSVFITGATVNTGLGIAEKFAKEGYNLFLGSRNAENAEKTAKELSEKYGVYAKGYGMKIFDEENTKEIFTAWIVKSNATIYQNKLQKAISSSSICVDADLK